MTRLNDHELIWVYGGISDPRRQILLDLMSVYIFCGHPFREFLDEVARVFLKADEIDHDFLVFLKSSWNAVAA